MRLSDGAHLYGSILDTGARSKGVRFDFHGSQRELIHGAFFQPVVEDPLLSLRPGLEAGLEEESQCALGIDEAPRGVPLLASRSRTRSSSSCLLTAPPPLQVLHDEGEDEDGDAAEVEVRGAPHQHAVAQHLHPLDAEVVRRLLAVVGATSAARNGEGAAPGGSRPPPHAPAAPAVTGH